MASLYIADYITAFREAVQITGDDHWTDAEITAHLAHVLRDFSVVIPTENKSTAMVTVEDSYDVDISALTGLQSIDRVEYPIDKNPKSFRPFSLWGDTLTLEIETRPPDADEEVYIWWRGPHTVGAAASTVPARFESTVINGLVAYCYAAWFHKGLDAIHGALARLTAAETALDFMAAKVATGFTQLGTADSNLDTNYPAINTLITELGDQIALLIADIATSRAAIVSSIGGTGNIAKSLIAAGNISTGVAGAVTDAGTSSMDRGQYYINRINVGAGVNADWLNSARTELSLANVYAAQAHAYLAADKNLVENLHTAQAELGGITALSEQIRATMRQSDPNQQYGALMSKYNEAAGAAIFQAQGHLHSATSRLQVGNVIANYAKMADIQVQVWKRDLGNMRPYRIIKTAQYFDP